MQKFDWKTPFLIFLAIELAGLAVGSLIISNVSIPVKTGASESLFFFLYILATTAIVIALVKYLPKGMKALELFVVFLGSEVLFEILFMYTPNPTIPSVILALLVTYLRLVFPDKVWSINLGALTTILGVGPLIGASLGVIPSIILLAILAVYDYISVFKTKHMVTLAKGVMKENIALMMAIPTRKRLFHIGGGDLIMPMMVSTSILRANGWLVAIISLVGGLIGLIYLLWYLYDKKGKVMPALPFITVGLLGCYLLSLGVKVLI